MHSHTPAHEHRRGRHTLRELHAPPLRLKLVPQRTLPTCSRVSHGPCLTQPCGPSPGSRPHLTLPTLSGLGLLAAYLEQSCLEASSLLLERTLLHRSSITARWLFCSSCRDDTCTCPLCGQERAFCTGLGVCRWARAAPEQSCRPGATSLSGCGPGDIPTGTRLCVGLPTSFWVMCLFPTHFQSPLSFERLGCECDGTARSITVLNMSFP